MAAKAMSRRSAKQHLVDSLVGECPWQVMLGHGTMATLDFGEPAQPIAQGRVARGTCHLWISGAGWRVETEGSLDAGSRDTGSSMATALRRLQDRRIGRILLPAASLDLVIEFEGGLALRTFRCSTEEDAWRFYSPSGSLYLEPNGALQLDPA